MSHMLHKLPLLLKMESITVNLKNIFAYLGIPPPLWVTISPSRIYEYYILLKGLDLHGTTVLDFGCGEGIFAIALSTLAKQVIAVDINPIAIKRAALRQIFAAQKKNQILCGNAAKLKPPNRFGRSYLLCVRIAISGQPAR